MTSLAHGIDSVQPGRWDAAIPSNVVIYPPGCTIDEADADEAFEPSEADLAWWASAAAATAPRAHEVHSDRAWLLDEARGLYRRDDESSRLAAAAIRCAAAGLEAMAEPSASAYLAGRPAPPPAGDAASPRTSPLAAELDVLAAWYRHLGTDAGDLAAWAVAWQAGECELAGARSIVDLRLWRDEAWESILDGRDEHGAFDDRPPTW